MQLKILVISSYDDNYNAVRPEGEIFIELQRSGVVVEIMTQGFTAYAERFRAEGIKVYDHHPTSKFSNESVKLIRKILKEGQHQILHLFNSKAIVNGIRAAWQLPVKVITYRGFAGHINWYDPSSYLTHLNPRIDKIMCVSKSIYDQLAAQFTLPEHKLVIIPKRHRVEWYQDVKAKDPRKEFGLPNTAFVVTCVANARKFKGIPYLLEATRFLPKGQPIYILLIGRGMDTEKHLQLINQAGLKEQVIFAGFRKDVLELIAGSDVLTLPSTGKEGLPKVVIEAMCLKTPVIATDITANQGLVLDRETALRIPIKDPQAITEAILNYYHHPELRQQIATNAYRFMQTEFTLDKTVMELKQLYNKIIST